MKYNKLVLIFVGLILFCTLVKADLIFDEVICKKDGSMKIIAYSDESKIPTEDIKIIAKLKGDFDLVTKTFELNGTWGKDIMSDGKTSFELNYPQIIDSGKYKIVLKYLEEESLYEVTCPGLIFSCEFVNVEIKNCTIVNNKYFNLLVELSGLEQSAARKIDLFEDINYNLVAENNYKDIRGLESTKGSLPENINVNKLSESLYLFSSEFENNSLISINVYLKDLQSECKDHNLYDYTTCSNLFTEKEIKGEENIKQVPKITGNTVKIKEADNNNYLIYISIFMGILLISALIFKKQKVNKWV